MAAAPTSGQPPLWEDISTPIGKAMLAGNRPNRQPGRGCCLQAIPPRADDGYPYKRATTLEKALSVTSSESFVGTAKLCQAKASQAPELKVAWGSNRPRRTNCSNTKQ
ncbi:hypothetical protein BHM03_00044893 [Ensete ventricosum]|nr:hypothetical protein BHM03_00044893 [Ensete ventricosum]